MIAGCMNIGRSAAQLTAPSVMLPSATAWIREAAARIQHLQGLETQLAMLRALDVLDWVEENCAPFGADGFDWSPDAGVVAVDEFMADA